MSARDASDALEIAFRPLAEADLSTLHGWLNEPEVKRWYTRAATTRDAIKRKYMRRIGGRSGTHVHVIQLNGQSAGIVQDYLIAGYPDYAAALAAEPGWAGTDFLLGAAFRGRRLAHRIVAQFVDEVVAGTRGATACVAAPDPDNVKSIRTLARAGFVFLRRCEFTSGERAALMIKHLGR